MGRRQIRTLRRDAKARAGVGDDGIEDEIRRRLYGERHTVERLLGPRMRSQVPRIAEGGARDDVGSRSTPANRMSRFPTRPPIASLVAGRQHDPTPDQREPIRRRRVAMIVPIYET
jgi:hypothetical protein